MADESLLGYRYTGTNPYLQHALSTEKEDSYSHVQVTRYTNILCTAVRRYTNSTFYFYLFKFKLKFQLKCPVVSSTAGVSLS